MEIFEGEKRKGSHQQDRVQDIADLKLGQQRMRLKRCIGGQYMKKPF